MTRAGNQRPTPSTRNAFTDVADMFLDLIEREDERRTRLTEEERAAEDRAAKEKQKRQREKWLAEHAKRVDIRVDRIEDGDLRMTMSARDRVRLREGGYDLGLTTEADSIWFQASDERWYPFDWYPRYDQTGEIPEAETAPNPIGERFWGAMFDRAVERQIGPFRPKPPEPEPELSHEEQVARELADLLAMHEDEMRRRAALTPEERAAEDRENKAELARWRAQAEEERRTTIRVRRQGDDVIHKLSGEEVRAASFQPLFAMRHGEEEVYFQAHDSVWYRIEAYPEYARSANLPADLFAAPTWEPERTPLDEALDQFRRIIKERRAEHNEEHGGDESEPG